jgi:hypothetical protein
MPIIKKKTSQTEIKKTTCKKCGGTNFGKFKKDELDIRQEYFKWTGQDVECKDCVIKVFTKFQDERKAKQIPYWTDLRPKLEWVAKNMKDIKDCLLTPIKLDEARYIDCVACGFNLASNKCYVSKKAYYCWRDGEIIEEYFKQIKGIESKEQIRNIFTMRRYSLKDNRFGRWLVEGVIDNFGKKYCAECVFLNEVMGRKRWGNPVEEFVPCFLSIKILQTDFKIDETIRSSVGYYCKKHCLDWLGEMAKSKDDVIGVSENVIQKMEERVLQFGNNKMPF